MIRSAKTALDRVNTDVLIVPTFKDEGAFNSLIKRYDLDLSMAFKSGEFSAKECEILLIHLPNRSYKRLMLVGLGELSSYKTDPTDSPQPEDRQPFRLQELLRRTGGKALRYALERGFSSVCIDSHTIETLEGLSHPAVFYLLEGGLLNLYSFEDFKTKKEAKKDLKEIVLTNALSDSYIKRLLAVMQSYKLARDLINSPANRVTPTYLYEVAKSLSPKALKVHCLDTKQLQKLGMNGVLAVAKGSDEPPCFIVIEHLKTKGSPVVVIGKSVTFDSGGLSLKPSEGMEKMKYDMAGGAVVLALMKAVADMGLKKNVVGILPAVENLPDGKAYKPGDVVKMKNGKTVEIVSTDAEGRMTLADALTYGIEHYKPSAIIDIATLTGACAITFGNEYIGMMGNSKTLMDRLVQSGNETYERVWPMPLAEEFAEYIKGEVADIKNSGGRNGSMLTAGYFLKEFVGNTPWTHLDIASTAWLEKDKPYLPKGASSSGLRLLLDYLISND